MPPRPPRPQGGYGPRAPRAGGPGRVPRSGGDPARRLRRLLVLLGLVLLFALAVSLLEKATGQPLWDELYQAAGLPAAGSPAQGGAGETAVHFIDIGQGDAVLIEQDGEFCLIDAGLRDTQDDLIAYLEAAGASRLRLLVMTHPHSDHIGGMREVLRRCTVDEVLLPDFDKAPLPASTGFTRILEELEAQQILASTARAGDSYPIGTGVLQVLADGVETENYNDLSPVLRFVGPGLTFVDTGDGEQPVEQDALARAADLSADLYKAAHHGSNTSNTAEFLAAVRPQVVVACCGQDNAYGHPHREPRERFAQIGADFYRTDRDGTVVVTGNGREIWVWTANEGRGQSMGRDAA